MHDYIALLRGINVGGRVIKMADLKVCLTRLGLANVDTVLQSGNVRFTTDTSDLDVLRQMIEKGLSEAFNYPARIQLTTPDNLRKIIADYPWPANPETQSYVLFMDPGLPEALYTEAQSQLDPAVERIACGRGVLYWQVPKGQTLKSVFAQFLTKTTYKNGHTNRNLNTLTKLIAR